MSPIERRLLIFARYPEPGRVKTRLIGRLGADGAAALYTRLAMSTLRCAREAAETIGCKIEVHFDGADLPAMQACFGQQWNYRRQVPGDLGERMVAAFGEITGPAVVIGTDCPDLRPAHLGQAFDSLREADLVLGPAHDGGYYLLGLNHPIPELFAGIAWSTEHVLASTLAIADDLRLRRSLLDRLADIDRPEDLHLLCSEGFADRDCFTNKHDSSRTPA